MENFKQTLKEVFSLSPDEMQTPAPAERRSAPAQAVSAAPGGSVKPAASFLAAGTAFEGTLRAAGDVEIAGNFKGSITSNGVVKLLSDIESSVTAGSVTLSGCTLAGDVIANGTVTVSEGSKICGNVTARELLCAGEITGDLKIAGNTSLERTAQINGRILTGTIAVVKGAVIKGGMEMKLSADPKAAEHTPEAAK